MPVLSIYRRASRYLAANGAAACMLIASADLACAVGDRSVLRWEGS